MVAEQLSPRTVNTYLSLLGTTLNAAVDDDYLTRSPLLRKSGAGCASATRNQPVRQHEVWDPATGRPASVPDPATAARSAPTGYQSATHQTNDQTIRKKRPSGSFRPSLLLRLFLLVARRGVGGLVYYPPRRCGRGQRVGA
jgi:hypothetical protein